MYTSSEGKLHIFTVSSEPSLLNTAISTPTERACLFDLLFTLIFMIYLQCVQMVNTRDVFYVRREVDVMKTAKANAYIIHIFGKIELLSIHAT